MVKITFNNASAYLAPLYRRYPGQTKPQPAFVSLDGESGELSAYVGEWGSTPIHTHNGLATRWRIPETLRGEAIDRLLLDIRPIAERLVAGFETYWDGSNRRGRWEGDDALSEEIGALIDEYSNDETRHVVPWSVGDWLGSSFFRDLVLEGETVGQAAERLNDEASAEGILLEGDVEKYLRDLYDRETDAMVDAAQESYESGEAHEKSRR